MRKNANEVAIHQHLPVRSAYRARNGASIWVLTATDRTSTVVRLPDEA